MRWPIPGSSLATQKAARRPPTGAILALRLRQRGWGFVSPSPPAPLPTLPKARAGPCVPAALPWFPLAAALVRLGKEAEIPSRLRRLGFGRGWGAAEASP